MVQLMSVVQWLDNYLKIHELHDDSYNGLQVEGKSEVRSVVFTTDAGIATFEKAIELHADMIVVHHGIFWEGVNPSVRVSAKDRIALLLKHGISLYAVHLPLDRHPSVGNNAQLLKILGFEQAKPFALYKGVQISFTGTSATVRSLDDIVHALKTGLGASCIMLPFGKKEIRTIAVCSGGAGYGTLTQAIDSGVDAYVSGEAFECYHTVKDAQFNVIFAGHHATETVGVKALSEVVSDALNIQTIYVDIPTGF